MRYSYSLKRPEKIANCGFTSAGLVVWKAGCREHQTTPQADRPTSRLAFMPIWDQQPSCSDDMGIFTLYGQTRLRSLSCLGLGRSLSSVSVLRAPGFPHMTLPNHRHLTSGPKASLCEYKMMYNWIKKCESHSICGRDPKAQYTVPKNKGPRYGILTSSSGFIYWIKEIYHDDYDKLLMSMSIHAQRKISGPPIYGTLLVPR